MIVVARGEGKLLTGVTHPKESQPVAIRLPGTEVVLWLEVTYVGDNLPEEADVMLAVWIEEATK